jgi:hypothetical protein
MLAIEPDDDAAVNALLDAKGYLAHIASLDH